MSMFSVHYMIANPNGLYWNGGDAKSFGVDPVRFHSKESAEWVRDRLLRDETDLRIVEDE